MLRRRVAALPALPDERLRLLGRRRRACAAARRSSAPPAPAPASAAAARSALRQRPAPRLLAELGVLPDPGDVGVERLGEPVRALLEPRCVVEEDEVQLRERLRHRLSSTGRHTIGAKRLFSEAANATSLQRDIGGHRIGAQHEHHGVGARDQRLDALPPFLEGVDVCAVDQRLEAARLQRHLQPIGKGHVLARIGDEDLGFVGPLAQYDRMLRRALPRTVGGTQ